MRVMLKITIPTAAGNAAIKSGALEKAIGETLGRTNAEAAYFTIENGQRTGLIFFDLADQTQMPSIGEPLFSAFDAKLELTPCMNGEDLQKGLAAWGGA